jgi:hypothetical protein
MIEIPRVPPDWGGSSDPDNLWRFLGWDYEKEKRHDEGARIKTYYRLIKSASWPENVGAAIAAEGRRRRRARQSGLTQPHSTAEPRDP